MSEPADRPARKRRRRCLFFLLALAAVSILLHAAKKLRQAEVRGLHDQEAMLTIARPVEKTKARRASFYKARFYLGYPAAASYAAAGLARRVEAAVPPLRLLALQAAPGMHDLGFELTVGTDAALPRAARRRIAALLDRLRALPGIFPAESAAVDPAAAPGYRHLWIVSGRAEILP